MRTLGPPNKDEGFYMSLGSVLGTKENLELVSKKSWKFGRALIQEQGMRYYDTHSDKVDVVVKNLAHMGLQNTGVALDDVLQGIIAHYYEKLFVVVKGYEAYWIAQNRIEVGDSLSVFQEARDTGKGVFIGQSHFGALYLMATVLMTRGYDINSVAKFPEPIGSMLQDNMKNLSSRYNTGSAHLLNLADKSLDVPGEMIRLLMQRKVVSNVFDENNQFCKPVKLLGQTIMGGTGMDLILKMFNDDNLIVVTPFLVRTSDETFRYELDRHFLRNGNVIDSFYASLEKRIIANPEQWYFIHELHESFEDLRQFPTQ